MEMEILYGIQGIHTEVLNKIMIFLSTIGNAGICWIFLSLTLSVIPRTRKCGITMLCAMALTFLTGNIILKNLIARQRPCAVDTSVALLIPFPSEYSFPSGHTSNGITASVTLFLYYKKAGVIAILAALMIAFSRLYLFVHYPTDILGGIILGIIDACVIYYIFKFREKNKTDAMAA